MPPPRGGKPVDRDRRQQRAHGPRQATRGGGQHSGRVAVDGAEAAGRAGHRVDRVAGRGGALRARSVRRGVDLGRGARVGPAARRRPPVRSRQDREHRGAGRDRPVGADLGLDRSRGGAAARRRGAGGPADGLGLRGDGAVDRRRLGALAQPATRRPRNAQPGAGGGRAPLLDRHGVFGRRDSRTARRAAGRAARLDVALVGRPGGGDPGRGDRGCSRCAWASARSTS